MVAPPTCIVCSAEGAVLCADCTKRLIIPYGETCWNCAVRSPGGRTCRRCRLPGTPSYVWLATSYDDTAALLLKVYKFGHLRAAADTLSRIMVGAVGDFLPEDALKSANYLVVPVPTATSRRRSRGFGHSELLARKIAAQLGLKYLPALGRLGQSRQVGSRRELRLSQSDGKYFVRLPRIIKGRRILLVDDVVTTGATLRAATKALRTAGARQVDALAFAKSL